MARKLIDIIPRILVSPASGIITDRREAQRQGDELRRRIRDALGAGFEISSEFEFEHRCEHCNSTWTEDSSDYNGGCCAQDEANDPVRLQSLKALAEDVSGADLYRIDEDGRRDRVSVDWPWALASAVIGWLGTGRPADQVPALLGFADRVDATEWCTVWEDPGVYPSNAGGAALPDQVNTATEPNELASDVRRLIDDMGLTPVRAVA